MYRVVGATWNKRVGATERTYDEGTRPHVQVVQTSYVVVSRWWWC